MSAEPHEIAELPRAGRSAATTASARRTTRSRRGGGGAFFANRRLRRVLHPVLHAHRLVAGVAVRGAGRAGEGGRRRSGARDARRQSVPRQRRRDRRGPAGLHDDLRGVSQARRQRAGRAEPDRSVLEVRPHRRRPVPDGLEGPSGRHAGLGGAARRRQDLEGARLSSRRCRSHDAAGPRRARIRGARGSAPTASPPARAAGAGRATAVLSARPVEGASGDCAADRQRAADRDPVRDPVAARRTASRWCCSTSRSASSTSSGW